MPFAAVLGADLSHTATGLAWADGTATIKPGKLLGWPRIRRVRDAVLGASDDGHGRTLVVVEGYSYGSPNNAHSAGELGGIVREALDGAGIAYIDVAPAALKKYATGKGNANKDAVLLAAARAGFDGDNNNTADAWWLHAIGHHALTGLPFGAIPNTAYRSEVAGHVSRLIDTAFIDALEPA